MDLQRVVPGGLLDEDGAVLVHPLVIGEMVLEGLSARDEGLLARLPAVVERAVISAERSC